MGSVTGALTGGLLGGPYGGAAGGAMGKGGNAPSHPDFEAAATPNQTNAFGVNSQWNKGPGGQWNQNVSFGGPLAGLSQGLQGQAASAWGTPLDNGQQARTAASNAIYGQETSRLDPMWQQREHAFQADLANQGIDPNSEAYAKAAGNFGRDRNDAYQQANYGSIIGGGQEAQRQQQMDLQSRMAPLQGLGGLSGLTGQSANPLLPAAIAQYQGDLTKYGINQEGKNSTLGALASLGGSAMKGAGASGAAQKTAVIGTGGFINGVREVHFEYKDRPGQPYVGVLAEDVAKVFPNEVDTTPDGRKWVSNRFMAKPIRAALEPYLDDMPRTKSELRLMEIEREAADEAGIGDLDGP